MLIVRCTAKLLDRLKVPPGAASSCTTALGDWYATIPTRLPMVLRARVLSTLATRIPEAITDVLRGFGVDPAVIDREKAAMAEIVFDRTASRSVLGTMNEHAFHLGLARDAQPSMAEHALSMDLGRMLVTVPGRGYQHPGEFAAQVLGSSQPGPLPVAPPSRRARAQDDGTLPTVMAEPKSLDSPAVGRRCDVTHMQDPPGTGASCHNPWPQERGTLREAERIAQRG